MEAHRKQLALDEIGLRRLTQPDRHVGFAHRKVELFVGGQQREVDVGIEVDEFAEPRGEPMHADAGRCLHLEFAVRPLLAVGQLGAGGFELHEDVVRGVVQQFALLGQDETAGMTVKQRDAEFLFERGDLPGHCGLRQSKLLAGMREAAGFGGSVKNLELVPVHVGPDESIGAVYGAAGCRTCYPFELRSITPPLRGFPHAPRESGRLRVPPCSPGRRPSRLGGRHRR